MRHPLFSLRIPDLDQMPLLLVESEWSFDPFTVSRKDAFIYRVEQSPSARINCNLVSKSDIASQEIRGSSCNSSRSPSSSHLAPSIAKNCLGSVSKDDKRLDNHSVSSARPRPLIILRFRMSGESTQAELQVYNLIARDGQVFEVHYPTFLPRGC